MMNSRRLVLFSLLCMGATDSLAQNEKETIIVNVVQKDSAAAELQGVLINGYARSISGQVLEYRSPHPDAATALLVRARKDVHSISWETDTIPDAVPGQYYHFLWLAGLEREGFQNLNEVHSFDLLINGEKWFTFTNRKDSTAKRWTVTGRNGGELSFEATMVDRVGDLFGHMRMKLPKANFTAGRPLVLQVNGEDAESSDWFMVFQYSFNFVPRLRVEPVLMREATGQAQGLRLSLDNLQAGRTLEVRVPGRPLVTKPLSIGANVSLLPMNAVTTERRVRVLFTLNGKTVKETEIVVKPVASRDIYLLSYSHNDIGYTDLQPNIEKKQWRNIEEALEIIKRTKDYPPEARYKWNMEVLWSLDSYLRQASEERRQEVIEAIRSGAVGLNALYANVLTGLANAVEMSHFTAFARELSVKFSIPITSALVSDIPGFTWGIVPTLARSGAKYFSISPNPFDRIGFTIESWGDKPFYWISQSGQERVLTWVAGASYASFHEGDLTRLGDEKLLKLVRRLDETNYPYEVVQLPYTIGGDNGPPDPALPDFVKQWNGRYVTPRLIIATHRQMFEEFERRYGGTLPSFKGDFTPYWEDGALSSAYETALNRQAADRLIQGEALWSMIAPQSFPEQEYAEAWRKVIFYDEHTWGAWNSVSEPDAASVQGQWKIKRQFAHDADSLSKALLARVVPQLPGKKQKAVPIDVYNTLAWPRTDLVVLSRGQSAVGDRVTDEQGKPVPSQRLSTGELAFLAVRIPSMSAKRFLVTRGNAYTKGSIAVSENSLESSLLSITVNEQTGALSNFTGKDVGIDFVDRASGRALNEYVYVPGKDPRGALGLTNVKVRVKEKGNLVAALLVEADAPGCKEYSSEIRVIEGIARVDIINNLDKNAVRVKEGVHMAFPLNVPAGELRYDVADGIVRPEADQLPGACKNFFSVQSWVDVSNDLYGVTWATADAPLIEIGAITAEQPWMKTIAPSNTFYSYVMNNYWHTNYKADQEGPVTFRYSLRPHKAFRPAEAVRFAKERREPLIVAVADPDKPSVRSLFHIDSFQLVVLSVKPLGEGRSWQVCLYNPNASVQNVLLSWHSGVPVTLYTSDSFGNRLERVGGPIEVAAYGGVYLRIDVR